MIGGFADTFRVHAYSFAFLREALAVRVVYLCISYHTSGENSLASLHGLGHDEDLFFEWVGTHSRQEDAA